MSDKILTDDVILEIMFEKGIQEPGTIDKYDCFGNVYLISEQLWVDGLRKARVKEYSLNNPCHSANSNLVVAKKTTIIYDNNESYFNI